MRLNSQHDSQLGMATQLLILASFLGSLCFCLLWAYTLINLIAAALCVAAAARLSYVIETVATHVYVPRIRFKLHSEMCFSSFRI